MSDPFIMPGRLVNLAPLGSLLKADRALRDKHRKEKDLGRSPREHDAAHLAAIRQCPCLKCGMVPSEAAHVRMSSGAHGKRNAGIGAKPDDKWVISLCRDCHREQHKKGEAQFWYELGLSPFHIAQTLYALSPDVERMSFAVRTFIAERK